MCGDGTYCIYDTDYDDEEEHAESTQEVSEVQPLDPGGVRLPTRMELEQIAQAFRGVAEATERYTAALRDALSALRGLRSEWGSGSHPEQGSWWVEPPE